MKNILLKSLFLIALISVSFTTTAQDLDEPGSESNQTDVTLEGGDPEPAPIDGKIVWLLVGGISFAYYSFNKKRVIKA